MKVFYLIALGFALFGSAQVRAEKVFKSAQNTAKKTETYHTGSPIVEEKDELPAHHNAQETSPSHAMDIEDSKMPSAEDIQKIKNMTMLFEAALKNIANDFGHHDLEHIRSTFNKMTPQQQQEFLKHFSFERVHDHLLKNLNSVYQTFKTQ